MFKLKNVLNYVLFRIAKKFNIIFTLRRLGADVIKNFTSLVHFVKIKLSD